MKNPVTIQQVIDTTLELIKAHPNNVYSKPENRHNCSYNKGICSDGSIGCLFGQVLKKLGFTEIYDGPSINSVLEDRDIGMTPDQRDWLTRVQSRQDSGDTWVDALKAGNEAFPDVCK